MRIYMLTHIVAIVIGFLACLPTLSGEVTESWLQYKERTEKERKKHEIKPTSLSEIHDTTLSRQKRAFFGFPTGSKFTITPVLCIPVINLGDLSGALDVELPFVINLPNITQITSAFGRKRQDRVGLYSVLISTLNKFGLNGRACLLRAICEVSETPLHGDGLIGEVINIMLSLPPESSATRELKDFEDASYYGRAYGNCPYHYPECPLSIFKLIES